MSFEDRLRRSLETRADDVTPDPALFSVVQSRIRRGRTFRFALAGVAATLTIGGAALAAPTLINRRIEFEPRDLATQPQGTPDATPTAPATVPATEAPPPVVAGPSAIMVFTDGAGVYSMATDGESAEELIADPCPQAASCDRSYSWQHVAAAPGADPAAPRAVAAMGCGGLGISGKDTPVMEDTCPTSVTLSPDARHVAWVGQAGAEGQWTLQTADWTGVGIGDTASFGLDLRAEAEVRIEDWVWAEDGEEATGWLFLRVVGPDVTDVYRLGIERQGDGALAVPSTTLDRVETEAGWTTIAFAYGGGDYAEQEDTLYRMEVQLGSDGVEAARIFRTVGPEGGGILNLPVKELTRRTPGNQRFELSWLWMTASGSTVVYGSGPEQTAWVADFSTSNPGPTPLGATISHADLVPPQPDAGPTSPLKTLPVQVHFGMEGAEACVANQQVTRFVQPPAMARGALTELLEGPTSRESNEGIVSPFTANTAGLLNDITIVDGRAKVDFSSELTEAVGTDGCVKSAIIDSLDKTLSQFSTITSTRYTLNGDSEAWNIWIGQDSEHTPPPAAVTETAEAIRAAAEVKDWQALRELSRETACTMSDQQGRCVPYWKDQEAQGEDPLGVMVQILGEAPTQNRDAPTMWVWPPEWSNPEASGYNGPRIGIDEDGVWRYFVQEGG